MSKKVGKKYESLKDCDDFFLTVCDWEHTLLLARGGELLRAYAGDGLWVHPCGTFYDEGRGDDIESGPPFCDCRICKGVEEREKEKMNVEQKENWSCRIATI
jgi:hypothetical protein